MSSNEHEPLATAGRLHVPWWLGSGVGLALLAAVTGVMWTLSWGIATQANTVAPPAAPWWEEADAAISSVSASPRLPQSELNKPRSGRTTNGGTPGARIRMEPQGTYGTDLETSPAPSEYVLQGEALRKRQRVRERRAIRADRELAEFIASVGFLDTLDVWVSPISADYRITATFGQSGSLWSNDHTGVDMAAPSGTAVVSVAGGTVTVAGDAGAYGMQVKVTHDDGTETSYSHMSRIDVIPGQVVTQGAQVGAVGTTGNSTGPHLHFELRPDGGLPVDPVDALLARGVAL